MDSSIGVGIWGVSVGFKNSYSEVDARHSALRLLIEMGAIETIGKNASIPYWRCLPSNKQCRLITDREGYWQLPPVKIAPEKIDERSESKEPEDIFFDEYIVEKIRHNFNYVDVANANNPKYFTSNSR